MNLKEEGKFDNDFVFEEHKIHPFISTFLSHLVEYIHIYYHYY